MFKNYMKSYVKDKLAEFNTQYNVKYKLDSCWDNDREIKKQWKKDREKIRLQWQEVNSISDVKTLIERYASTVKRYKNIRGVYTDSYDMDLALYKVVSALQKMARCYDIEALGFNKCSKEDIDDIFDNLYKILAEMEDVNMCRAMQD